MTDRSIRMFLDKERRTNKVRMFRYETHAHTSEGSKCSRVLGVDLVRAYKEMGFDGVFITDHFFNGNTTVEKGLPWAESVERFCVGYENARNEGREIGIDVFFGWEYSYGGTDFLTYGLNKGWLLQHPEVMELRTKEYCDLVHAEGGFIVQAHPFREASYIEMIRLLPRHVDAIEVVNGCRNDFENNMALMYADYYNLKHFAGSDNHFGYMERIAGIETQKRFETENDLKTAVLNDQTEIIDLIMHNS